MVGIALSGAKGVPRRRSALFLRGVAANCGAAVATCQQCIMAFDPLQFKSNGYPGARRSSPASSSPFVRRHPPAPGGAEATGLPPPSAPRFGAPWLGRRERPGSAIPLPDVKTRYPSQLALGCESCRKHAYPPNTSSTEYVRPFLMSCLALFTPLCTHGVESNSRVSRRFS